MIIIGSDLSGLGIPAADLPMLSRRLNELIQLGEITSIEQAREEAPKIDIFLPKQTETDRSIKQKTPRHTKKKGERY